VRDPVLPRQRSSPAGGDLFFLARSRLAGRLTWVFGGRGKTRAGNVDPFLGGGTPTSATVLPTGLMAHGLATSGCCMLGPGRKVQKGAVDPRCCCFSRDLGFPVERKPMDRRGAFPGPAVWRRGCCKASWLAV